MIVAQDCTFRFRTFPPLDKNGEPLVPSTHPSEEWAVAAAPAIPPRLPETEVAQRPAYISPFAAMSGALSHDVPYGLSEAVVSPPAPHEQAPTAPSTAASSPFSGLQFTAFDDDEEESQPVAPERFGSQVMPSPFALAQSVSSGDIGPAQTAGCSDQDDCSTRTSSGSSQQSESTSFAAGCGEGGMPSEASRAASTRSSNRLGSFRMEGLPSTASSQGSAVLPSPFAALAQTPSPALPPAITPMDTAPAMLSPFAAYMGNADLPPMAPAAIQEVNSNFTWALRQDSLALHKGAPAVYNSELRSSFSMSPPMGARTASSMLPPVEEIPHLRAPPADAKRLAWRAASSHGNPMCMATGNSRDVLSSSSLSVRAPSAAHMMPPPGGRSSKGGTLQPHPKRGTVITESWLESGDRAASGISQPSPRSSLSTFASASSSTSTSNSSAEVLELSERGFVRRAASAFVKAQIRSGAPIFGRSRSAGNAHPILGAKIRALECDALSAWPRRKLAADGEFRRIPSDPVAFMASLVEPLSGV
jgi:hypothetical protein